LHYAAGAGATSAVERLLTHGAKVDAADQYGTTPLMLACAAPDPDACGRLLRAGANVGAVDRAGHSALYYATRDARSAQQRALLAAGAVPMPQRGVVAAATVPGPAAACDCRCLRRLARRRRRRYAQRRTMLRTLLASGGDPNARTPHGDTALLLAVAADSPQSAAILLESGADPMLANSGGTTALGLATRLGRVAVVKVLLSHGVPANAREPREPPPLIAAIERGDATMVRRSPVLGARPCRTRRPEHRR